MLQALGKVTVPVPGTPVRITALTADPSASLVCHGLLIKQWPGNTGKIYVGTETMNAATGEGVYDVLAIPTANALPAFTVANTIVRAGLIPNQIWLDADVADEGALVTLLVT